MISIVIQRITVNTIVSTLYDIKLLSKYTRDGKEYSPLLSGGTIVD